MSDVKFHNQNTHKKCCPAPHRIQVSSAPLALCVGALFCFGLQRCCLLLQSRFPQPFCPFTQVPLRRFALLRLLMRDGNIATQASGLPHQVVFVTAAKSQMADPWGLLSEWCGAISDANLCCCFAIASSLYTFALWHQPCQRAFTYCTQTACNMCFGAELMKQRMHQQSMADNRCGTWSWMTPSRSWVWCAAASRSASCAASSACEESDKAHVRVPHSDKWYLTLQCCGVSQGHHDVHHEEASPERPLSLSHSNDRDIATTEPANTRQNKVVFGKRAPLCDTVLTETQQQRSWQACGRTRQGDAAKWSLTSY